MLFSACIQSEKKANVTSKSPVSGYTLLEDSFYIKLVKILPDTAQTLKDFQEFAKQNRNVYQKLDEFLESEKTSDSLLNKIHNDSATILYQDYEQYLSFKLIKSLPRTLQTMGSSIYMSPYSRLVSIEERISLFKTFPLSIQKSTLGKKTWSKIVEYSFPNVAKNLKSVVDFKLHGQDGNEITFSSLYNNGKKKLLIFGASWCGPCVTDELKLFRNLNSIDTNKIEIIGFSVDKNSKDWYQYISKYKIPWKTFVLENDMNSPIIKFLNFEGVPHCLFVDENGIILKEHTSYTYVLP